MLQDIKTLLVIETLVSTAVLLFTAALKFPLNRQVVSRKAQLFLCATPLVAFFGHNVYIFYAAIFLIIVSSAGNRLEVASIYLMMLPTMPLFPMDVKISGAYIGAVTIVTSMNAAAFAGFLLSNHKAVLRSRYDWPILILVSIFMYIYIRDSSITGVVRLFVLQVIALVFPFIIISRSISNLKDILNLILRFLVGCTVTSLSAVFQSVKHWTLYEYFYHWLNQPLPTLTYTSMMRGGFLRTGGSMLDYSAGGLLIACAICILPFTKLYFRRLGYWAILSLFVLGLFATQSRGAWIAALLGSSIGLVYRRRAGIATILLIAAAFVESAVYLGITNSRLASIAGNTSEASGTVDYRKLLLQQGFRQFLNHPLFGQRPSDLVKNLPDLVQGEGIVDFVNAHLFIAMSGGFLAFVLWVAVWISCIVLCFRVRYNKKSDFMAAGIPMVMVVSMVVGLSATSLIDRNMTWAVIALGLAGPCCSLSQIEYLKAKQARWIDRNRPRENAHMSIRPGDTRGIGKLGLANVGEDRGA